MRPRNAKAQEEEQQDERSDKHRDHERQVLFLARLMAGLFAIAALAPPALAAMNTYYNVPNYCTTVAKAKITSYSSPFTGNTTTSGSFNVDPTNSNCVYLSARHIFDFAPDGTKWHKVSSNACGGSLRTISWSNSSIYDVDAYQFRLCRDALVDSCNGSHSVVVRP